MKKIFLFLFSFALVISGTAQTADVKAAVDLVTKNRSAIGISEKQAENYTVSSTYKSGDIRYAYLLQSYKGLPVYTQMIVLAFKNDELVTKSGGFISDIEKLATVSSAQPSLNPAEAVRRAFAEQKLSVPALSAALKNDGKTFDFGRSAEVFENITGELEWYPVETAGKFSSVSLVWEVVVAPKGNDDVWHVFVDANTGAVLHKENIVMHDSWNRPSQKAAAVHLQEKPTAGNFNFLSPSTVANATYRVIPFPAESPKHPGGTPALVNNPWTAAPGNATTLNWHSDATGTDYNYTRGNNVYASEDVNANSNNSGNTATSSTLVSPLNFDFTPNLLIDPRTPTNQQFTITNLFYLNNIIHDVTYQYGFDEVGGNYQQNNLSRGGVQNDYVQALAQSGGTNPAAPVAFGNNANFTPSVDGVKGLMRMYLFSPLANVHVNTPSAIAGDYFAAESQFSDNNKLPVIGPVTAPAVFFNDNAGPDHQACSPSTGSLSGKIAVIYRGNCAFVDKALAAQAAGAVGVIIINNVAGAIAYMAGSDNSITIPAVMISDVNGATLVGQITNNLNVTLSGTAPLDGDLDAGVVFHEYTHGISTRLTGGPTVANCLTGTGEKGGEGWSDYFALMLTTKWSTATTADGPLRRPMGTYVNGELPSGDGIRNYPYTTDMSINPLTYAHLGLGAVSPWQFSNGSEIHNIGEVWCAALWDMTWGIIQQQNNITPSIYTYSSTNAGGNTISMKLVMEGMKLQPCNPGFIDARNAILAADRNLYAGKHACAIWTAFARRAMGYGASQGSSASVTDQTPSTTMPPAPTVSGQPSSTAVAQGANVTFTANAGSDINLIYTWQVSTNGGGTWTDVVPAVITPSLTLNGVTCAMNNNQYRAVVSIGCATTITNVATLTVNGCVSTPAITLSSAAGTNNQTVCVNSPITNIVYATTGGVTGASITSGALPAGVTAAYSGGTNGTFTISGTPTATGTFNYTITTTGGTPNATASGTIIVNANSTITLSSAAGTNNQTVPVNTAITNITYTTANATGATITSGTLPAGVTGTFAGGVFTISGTPTVAGTFPYTVTTTSGCASATATGTITVVNSSAITLTSAAGTNAQTKCINTAITNITYSTAGGVTGASITSGALPAGVTGAYAAGVFTISGTPTVAGTFNYTITTSGGIAPNATASGTITVTASSAVTLTSAAGTNAQTICQNTPLTNITYSTSNGVTGASITSGALPAGVTGAYSGGTNGTFTISGTPTVSGTFNYTVTATGGCGTPTATGTITVNPGVSVTLTSAAGTNSQTVCVNTAVTSITYSTAGGATGATVANLPAGVTGAYSGGTNGTFTISGTPTATGSFTYTVTTSGGCAPVSVTGTVTVNPASTITLSSAAGTNAQSVCLNTAIAPITYAVNTGVTGASISAGALPAGVTGTFASGVFTISGTPTASGTFNYTVTTSGGCGTVSASGTITVRALTSVTLTSAPATNNQTVCSGGPVTAIVYTTANGATGATVSGLPTGVTGTYSGGTNGTFTITGTPTVSGTFNYTVTTTGGCGAATATGTIIATGGPAITTQPVSITSCTTTATFSVTATGGGLTYVWQVSTNAGGTWTAIPGQTSSTLTLTGLTAAQASNLYRVVISSGCGSVTSNSVTAQIGTPPVVVLTAAPSTAYNPSQGGGLFATVSPTGNYVYQWKRDNDILPVITSSITAANGLLYNFGTYQVRATDVATGCSGLSNFVTITDVATSRDRLFIWPNPTRDMINLSFFNSAVLAVTRSIVIYDSKGAKVMTKDVTVAGVYGTMTMDLSKLVSGTYTVMLADASGKKLASASVVKY